MKFTLLKALGKSNASGKSTSKAKLFFEPQVSQYKDNIQMYMETIGIQVYIISFVLLSSLVVYLINVAIRYYKYRKWIKDNKIIFVSLYFRK
jgi:hypothetical protein